MKHYADQILKEYRELESPQDINFSIKLVIPCNCNARCKFCFNNQTKETAIIGTDEFFTNCETSFGMILDSLERDGRKDISLDITGNEPTFNVEVFAKVMEIVKKFKNRFTKVVLTSNGFHLLECVPYIYGIIDYVNISVHRIDYKDRQKVFGIKKVMTDADYENVNYFLNNMGIKTTAVAVVFGPFTEDFKTYVQNFVKWAVSVNFSSIRFRSNFCSNDSFIEDYFYNTQFDVDYFSYSTKGLYTRIMYLDDIEIRFLRGIPDLTDVVVGVEAVIDDNGKCYIDYNKRYPITSDVDFTKVYEIN